MEIEIPVPQDPAEKLIRLRQGVFLAFAAAFLLLPLFCPPLRNHAPGVAVICGVIFSVAWGNPFETITSKLTAPLLGAAIVGMGFGMNLTQVLRAGAHGIVYTCAEIALGLGLGVWMGKKLGLPKHTLYLISVGTSICGGSAIAAAAPVLKAKAHDIAIASAVVFTLNAVALLVFPAVGHALGMNQYQFGCWAALGIHDTSSVVGAAMSYGQEALEVGTTVKLARALWIIPVTLFLSMFVADAAPGEKRKIKFRVPWFIPGFLIASALVTWVPGTAEGGAVPEGVLDLPDDSHTLPHRRQSQPGEIAGAGSTAGSPRRGALDHPRRDLVRGDSLRLRALKQPAFPRPPLTEGGFCLPRPRSSAGSNPIAEKILPDSPGGRRIRCEFPVEPNRLLRRIEPDFHRSGTFGTPPYDSMNLFFYKTGPGPKLPATPLPGGNPQPCPGCAAPKQDGETRRWSGVIHFTKRKKYCDASSVIPPQYSSPSPHGIGCPG